MSNHKTKIVRKPWGYEYLVYENKDVAMWLLYIRQSERTSMHCHPSKSTGLIVVDGEAEINFIADSRRLKAPDKQMIRRGLFHQTIAVSDHVLMFEIETPVDKNDLVRLRDSYGRVNSGYEDSSFELPKNEDCLWIQDPIVGETHKYQIGSCNLEVITVDDLKMFDTLNDEDIIVFLNGAVTKTIDDRLHSVLIPGDVGKAKIVKQVTKEMTEIKPETVIMIIK